MGLGCSWRVMHHATTQNAKGILNPHGFGFRGGSTGDGSSASFIVRVTDGAGSRIVQARPTADGQAALFLGMEARSLCLLSSGRFGLGTWDLRTRITPEHGRQISEECAIRDGDHFSFYGFRLSAATQRQPCDTPNPMKFGRTNFRLSGLRRINCSV